jgi:glycosyltransferase involved in cell wall biosynthesis
LALLEACELLWQRGLKFELHLIGLAQRQTGAAALALIEKLQRAGRPLRYEGAVTDEAREEAYAAASFTVYPSLAEGFGLPVAESLMRGKPCICSSQGALGEIAAGGGCLTVLEPSRDALAAAGAELLQNPDRLSALSAAARARVFDSPADHARRLLAWMETLRR